MLKAINCSQTPEFRAWLNQIFYFNLKTISLWICSSVIQHWLFRTHAACISHNFFYFPESSI